MPEPIQLPIEADEPSIARFLDQAQAQIDAGCRRLTIDCAPIWQATSSHVKALWAAYQLCEDRECAVALVEVGNGLRRVLAVLDLIDYFIPEHLSTERWCTEMQPTSREIDQAMPSLVEFLASNGVPTQTVFELQTVFYEIATNIRTHACLSEGKLMRCEAEVQAGQVVVTFIDRGIPFDPTEKPPAIDVQAAARERRRHGLGLTLIQRLCETISYQRTGGGANVLTIRKTW